MSSWRDAILNDFVPNVSKLTLVADPDCLLTEEKLALELRRRGFDLIEFSDPVEFRYAYESRYRSIWDRGEYTDLVVVLRLQDAELESLPYDLLQAGRKLSFNLGDLFPNHSYPVIEKLDRSLLDALFEAQHKSPPDRMGDNATRDFILRHVFGIAAELIANEVELLRALLRLHYGKTKLPDILAHRLIQCLQLAPRPSSLAPDFKAWPLSEIVPDDEAFFAFLQERWPVFLSAKCGVQSAGTTVFEPETHYAPRATHFRYAGPDHLPFDHQVIFVYLDNLFLEGKLKPVEISEAHAARRTSHYAFGVSGVDGDEQRISRLFDLIEKEQPTTEARYSDWIAFALKWAELSSSVARGEGRGMSENLLQFKNLQSKINNVFLGWLADHYASLINLPPTHPAMLHHVPRRLARDIEKFSRDRQNWINWLFEARKRYQLQILNYTVTSNHIHLLVFSEEGVTALPGQSSWLQAEPPRSTTSAKIAKVRFGKTATIVTRGQVCFWLLMINLPEIIYVQTNENTISSLVSCN